MRYRPLWIIAGIACGLAMLAMFAVAWSHDEWDTSRSLALIDLGTASGMIGGLCIKRGLSGR